MGNYTVLPKRTTWDNTAEILQHSTSISTVSLLHLQKHVQNQHYMQLKIYVLFVYIADFIPFYHLNYRVSTDPGSTASRAVLTLNTLNI